MYMHTASHNKSQYLITSQLLLSTKPLGQFPSLSTMYEISLSQQSTISVRISTLCIPHIHMYMCSKVWIVKLVPHWIHPVDIVISLLLISQRLINGLFLRLHIIRTISLLLSLWYLHRATCLAAKPCSLTSSYRFGKWVYRLGSLCYCLHAAAQCAHVDVRRDRCIWATMVILYTLRTHTDV